MHSACYNSGVLLEVWKGTPGVHYRMARLGAPCDLQHEAFYPAENNTAVNYLREAMVPCDEILCIDPPDRPVGGGRDVLPALLRAVFAVGGLDSG